MKFIVLVLLSLLAFSCIAEEKFYAVKTNSLDFPLPCELPDFSKQPAEHFDWAKYISSAQSDADRAFRKVTARSYNQPIAGGGDSTSENWHRYKLAASEFESQCDEIIKSYRKILADKPNVLADLNTYIVQSESTIKIQIKLIGDSWGGSGRKVAFAKARMEAYLYFYRNLQALQYSLHLQQ